MDKSGLFEMTEFHSITGMLRVRAVESIDRSSTRGQSLRSLLLLLLVALFASQPAFAKERRTLRAAGVERAGIVLDGRLDEAVWKKAPVSTGFVERTPNPGDPPPVETRVRIVYDDEALYVAVENEFAPGDTPRALELRRDSSRVWSDDAVTLKLDIALDRRTTLVFAVNAADTQIDAISLRNGRQFRREHDAVWSSGSHVEDHTWTIEYKLPYTALGLSAREGERTIGFNVSRDHNKRNATYDWSHLPPEFGPTAASHYGDVVGLKNIGLKGHPIRLYPFVLLRRPGDDSWSGDALDLRAGLDLKTRLGADLWAEMTALTDFAEVDLDDETVNLSRFPLYLPEKRPFFLAGLDVFDFGARRRSQIFFSRRIGIDGDGEMVPIWGGVKTYGRVGRFSVGLLNVVTAESAIQAQLNDSVGRILYTSEQGDTLGLMLVGRNSLDGSADTVTHHNAIGLDGSVGFLEKRLTLSGFSSFTRNDAGETEIGNSTEMRLSYRGERWQPNATVLRTDRHFSPEVGFVRRTDALETNISSGWLYRWSSGAISSVRIEPNHSELFSADAERSLGRSSSLSQSLRFRGGSSISAYGGYSKDVVEEAFDLPTDQTIDAGVYEGSFFGLSARTPWNKTPQLSASYDWSDAFYGGTKHTGYLGASSYVGPHVRLSLGTSVSWFTLPNAAEEETLTMNGGLTLAANPRLFWETNLQGNTVSKSGRILSRVRWRYLPGSDLFLVYQEDAELAGKYEASERRLVLKVTYWWDAVL